MRRISLRVGLLVLVTDYPTARFSSLFLYIRVGISNMVIAIFDASYDLLNNKLISKQTSYIQTTYTLRQKCLIFLNDKTKGNEDIYFV